MIAPLQVLSAREIENRSPNVQIPDSVRLENGSNLDSG